MNKNVLNFSLNININSTIFTNKKSKGRWGGGGRFRGVNENFFKGAELFRFSRMASALKLLISPSLHPTWQFSTYIFLFKDVLILTEPLRLKMLSASSTWSWQTIDSPSWCGQFHVLTIYNIYKISSSVLLTVKVYWQQRIKM